MTLAAAETELMTTEQLLALPDDGIERELIRGKLWEGQLTRRNRRHSRTETKIAKILDSWLQLQPLPRGEVLSGEAGFQLESDPDTTVGVDVAYISADTAAATPEDAFLIERIPVLAVEILSPSDQQRTMTDKIQSYLDAGVALVWIVEPVFRTITVYRPDALPSMFNTTQQLSAEPHLPGFTTPVAAIFEA